MCFYSQEYYSSVKSVDNQGVCNMGGHNDTNVGSSITQYQSKYAHVNRFDPLVVEDGSFAFDTNSSIARLHGVDAQVVETRAGEESKCHKKARRIL